MPAERPPIRPPDEVTHQVRVRVMRARNRRLARSIALVLAVTAVMIVLALSNRDIQALRSARQTAERIASALQNEFDTHRRPPTDLRFMGHTAEDRALQHAFQFNSFYPTEIRSARSVGVCSRKFPISLYLQASGRFVTFFDGERFETQWLTEDEFRKRAASLGFDVPREE